MAGQKNKSNPDNNVISIISLGCPKNLIDSEIILGILSKKGYKVSLEPKHANILIINTCSFIRDAIEESEKVISLAEGKFDKIIIAGCLPQRFGSKLFEKFPFINGIIGIGSLEKIDEILKRKKKVYLNSPNLATYSTAPRLLTTLPHTAYLKISDGCNNRCSYCLIPRIRGDYRSKPLALILQEAREIIQKGVREINLIGQDTTSYGIDLYGKSMLDKLLIELLKIKELKWIRLLYTHPANLKQEVIDIIAQEEKMCKYIDLPIQHIDDEILAKMNRKTTQKQISKLIENLRLKVPNIAIRTSLIAGLPGETDEKFDKLIRFIKSVEFDWLGAFIYSPEEGTPARSMPNQVPEEVKKKRYQYILDIQKDICAKKNRKRIGEITEVVIEGFKDELAIARSQREAPDIDGLIYIKDTGKKKEDIGKFTKVKIIGATDYDLLASYV
jgi:ribosomal protein S12 methylthiotransferase